MIVMMVNSAMSRSVGNIAMRRFSVSGVIRSLARLLDRIKSSTAEELRKKLTFFEALHPSQYDNFMKAVFAVCKEEAVDNLEEDDRLETEPAYPLRILCLR